MARGPSLIDGLLGGVDTVVEADCIEYGNDGQIGFGARVRLPHLHLDRAIQPLVLQPHVLQAELRPADGDAEGSPEKARHRR